MPASARCLRASVGKLKVPREYVGIVGSNTAGGALIGASVDATVLTGGLGAATVGALGGAGAALVTTAGESRGLGASLERAGYGAAGGAIGGAVLSKAAPLLGRVAGRVATWTGEHVPLASEAGQALSALGRRAAGSVGDAAEWVASKYKPSAFADRLNSASNPFQRFRPSSTSTAPVTIEESKAPLPPETTEPKTIEYSIAPHGQRPRPSKPFASHHGIQQKDLQTNVPGYDPLADPTIMLNDAPGKTHRKITGEQATQRAKMRRETGSSYGDDYGSKRAAAIEQMRRNGVPEQKIGQWLLEHDGYMFGIDRN